MYNWFFLFVVLHISQHILPSTFNYIAKYYVNGLKLEFTNQLNSNIWDTLDIKSWLHSLPNLTFFVESLFFPLAFMSSFVSTPFFASALPICPAHLFAFPIMWRLLWPKGQCQGGRGRPISKGNIRTLTFDLWSWTIYLPLKKYHMLSTKTFWFHPSFPYF